MVSLSIDEQTAAQLQALAAERGLTVEGLLKSLAGRSNNTEQTKSEPTLSVDEIESELRPLLFTGPSLPDDFSREDIYADHD